MSEPPPDPSEAGRPSLARSLLAGAMLAILLAAAGILAFRAFSAGDPFADRLAAIAGETFSAVVPLDRLAGYPVAELCLVAAGADPRQIATAGGMPASALINVRIEPGELGFLMHGQGQTTFGAVAASAWADAGALGRCFAGGGFTLSFSAVDPLRGGRLVLPQPQAPGSGVEMQPLPPLPR